MPDPKIPPAPPPLNLSDAVARHVARHGPLSMAALRAAMAPVASTSVDAIVGLLRRQGAIAPADVYRATGREGMPEAPGMATALRLIRSQPHTLDTLHRRLGGNRVALANRVSRLRRDGWLYPAGSVMAGPARFVPSLPHATDTRERIAEVIGELGPCASSDVADRIGRSRWLATKMLVDMEADGIVSRTGRFRWTRWSLTAERVAA